MSSLQIKYQKLKERLRELFSGVIAFSGGVDSGLLTKVAFDVLGNKILAVTGLSSTYPSWEYKEVKDIVARFSFPHRFIKTQELANKKFLRNKPDRCYWCKRELFSKLEEIRKKLGFNYLLDGAIFADSIDDVRPGLRANRELKVVSPLAEIGFDKQEIKKIAKQLSLPFSDKPSGTCLSSRIPWNESITKARLKRIEKAEELLRDFFGQDKLIRGRDHNNLLRIEVEEFSLLPKRELSNIIKKIKFLGYKYVTLDLEGYIPAGKK